MPKGHSTARARSLGAELKELRAKTRLSTRAVAERLGWSPSTLNRVETGLRPPKVEEIAALLVVYGVTGAERDRLLDLSREADQPGWWETARPDLPSQLTALVGFESHAVRITDMSTVLVPGLLQTPDYARAVMECSRIPSPNAETRVATRMGRQVILSRPEPPELLAIVDEAVLRRPVGGRKVMTDQLRHMVRVSERPNVTVRVIPFERGGHIGVNGPFVVLEFAKAGTIVHMEHLRSGVFVDDPKDVEPFLTATATLTEAALDPAASEKLLLAVADEYER
ncbi:MAG TPA: helix-turn-helix transcriptional regulator [Pseudonocardiaceae bacterium]|nr:helix-turn-helix transcriptional regulator [Pseudonocardiaceae bacterium]